MTTIVYVGEDKALSVADPAMTILDVSIAHKIPHVRACGGHGRCTTCRLRICDGIQNVSARTPRELEVANALRWDGFTRLACQTRVSGDVTLERLIRSPADVSCLQLEEASIVPPQERTLAILFSDIRSFTPFVEAHLAYDVVHILNRFFKAVGDAILTNNGVIYQYVGDQIVGLFGVGGDPPEKSCLDTIRAGLGMLAALNDLNADCRANSEQRSRSASERISARSSSAWWGIRITGSSRWSVMRSTLPAASKMRTRPWARDS